MVAGPDPARFLEPIGEPPDALGVLRVHHDHPARAARRGQHVEDLAVVELEVVVGHVDLERGDAVADESGKLLPADLRVRVGHDEVEGVVDDGTAVGTPAIVVHRPPQALAPELDGERDDGGGPAGGGGAGTGVEIVRAHRTVERALVQVAMGVDPARSHGAARRVDDSTGAFEAIRESGDAPVADPDVAFHHVGRGGDTPAADDDIEFAHARFSLADQPAKRPGQTFGLTMLRGRSPLITWAIWSATPCIMA